MKEKTGKQGIDKMTEFLKEADGESRTVLAVQIENEMGYANTDMDYSAETRRDYEKPVPGALAGVELPDSGRELIGEGKEASAWKRQFGRHAHEAFSAWYHARYIDEVASAGKAAYALPCFTNVMVGEQGYEEPGLCYNAGAAVGLSLIHI